MIARLRRPIETLLDRRVPATGLGVFRIALSIVMFFEWAQLLYFKALIFDPTPFLDPDYRYHALLAVWGVAILCLLIGWRTRPVSVINYMATVALLGPLKDFEYHYDYVLLGTTFLLIWIRPEAALSVDRWLARRRGRPWRDDVSVLSYYAPLIMGLGVVYLDSVTYKITSPMWLGGLGLWRPSSIPPMTWLNLGPLLDQEALVRGLSYLVLLFETIFCFVFFRRAWRVPILIFGVMVHVGITIAFPIPLFGIGSAIFYFLMVPFSFWRRVLPTASLAWEQPQPAEPALRTRRANAVLALVAVLALFQAGATYRSDLMRPMWRDVASTQIGRAWKTVVAAVAKPSRMLLGVTPHPVFMDSHFDGYSEVLALVALTEEGEDWLPIVDRQGQAAFPSWGRVWVATTFRVAGPSPSHWRKVRGLERHGTFWMVVRGHNLRTTPVIIRSKSVTDARAFRAGLWRQQAATPWRDVGVLRWRGDRLAVEWRQP
ncbi:MAG: HTTM domain-containing protein [Acidobacteriota bacterium]